MDFFQALAVPVSLYGYKNWILAKCLDEKWDKNYKNALGSFEQILEAAHHRTAAA